MRKSILSIFLISLMVFARENIDSLRWIEVTKEAKKGVYNSTSFETATIMADMGLYSEALSVLGIEKASVTEQAKPLMADIVGLYFYNKTEDINENELNQNQKDSVDLLKSHMGGIGFHLYIPSGSPYLKNGKKRKVPTEITPLVYFTNTVNRLGVNSKSYFFDSLITTNVELSAEKIIGKYVPDTTFDSLFNDDSSFDKLDTTVNPDKFIWTDYKPDSSDLLACIAQVQYEKMFDNFSITVPVRWLHYNFRTNIPILSSRSNISINPGFHVFSNIGKMKMDFSASCFIERQNHFGDGRTRDTLESEVFTADHYDKNHINPQISSEFSLGPVTIGHTFLMLLEKYTERRAQMEGFAQEQEDKKDTTGTLYSLGYGIQDKWINNTVKGEVKFGERVSYEVEVDILAATEKYSFTKYNRLSDEDFPEFEVIANDHDKKGTLYTIGQKLPCKIGSFLTLSPSFTLEWRYAPIADSVEIGSKVKTVLVPNWEQMFLWESYKTQGLGLTVQHRSKRGIISFEQRFNKEIMTVDDDIQTNLYNRFDGKVSESRLQTQLNFKHGISFSFNGLYSRKKSQDLSEEKLDIIKQNIALNFSFAKKFTFRNRDKE